MPDFGVCAWRPDFVSRESSGAQGCLQRAVSSCELGKLRSRETTWPQSPQPAGGCSWDLSPGQALPHAGDAGGAWACVGQQLVLRRGRLEAVLWPRHRQAPGVMEPLSQPQSLPPGEPREPGGHGSFPPPCRGSPVASRPRPSLRGSEQPGTSFVSASLLSLCVHTCRMGWEQLLPGQGLARGPWTPLKMVWSFLGL